MCTGRVCTRTELSVRGQGIHVQWNPYTTDTFGDQHFVDCSEVSPTQGLPVYFQYISVRRGMCNPAVEYNVAAYSELCFAVG